MSKDENMQVVFGSLEVCSCIHAGVEDWANRNQAAAQPSSPSAGSRHAIHPTSSVRPDGRQLTQSLLHHRQPSPPEHSVHDYKLDSKAHESHRPELPSPAFSVGLNDEQMGHRNVS